MKYPKLNRKVSYRYMLRLEAYKLIKHLLNEETYTLYVIKDGETIATYQNVKAFCTDVSTGNCQISLSEPGSTTRASSFKNDKGVSYLTSYNDSTRDFVFEFTSIDGTSKDIILNITKYDLYLNDTACSNTLSSSSGTMTCNIPSSYQNNTVIAKVFVNNEYNGKHSKNGKHTTNHAPHYGISERIDRHTSHY